MTNNGLILNKSICHAQSTLTNNTHLPGGNMNIWVFMTMDNQLYTAVDTILKYFRKFEHYFNSKQKAWLIL